MTNQLRPLDLLETSTDGAVASECEFTPPQQAAFVYKAVNTSSLFTHMHTDKHLPLGSNTEQYWQLGSQPRGCDGKKKEREREGVRRGKEERSNDREVGAPAAACTVRSCEAARQLWGGGEERRGSGRERERLWLQALLSLSHQIRRSSEREMPLCSKTSLLPPQTVAAGIQAHWFAARRGGGRRERRGEGGHRRQLCRGGRSAEGQTDFYLT